MCCVTRYPLHVGLNLSVWSWCDYVSYPDQAARGVPAYSVSLREWELTKCVASPASYNTVREGLNLPVWSGRDYSMLCFLPEHCTRACTRRVCPCKCGRVHIVASLASHSTVREGLNLPVWSWRDYDMLLYSARALREGLHTELYPCERRSVQVCSVTRVLQHCAHGIDSASVELAGLQHATVFCPSTARGKCGPASFGVYRAARTLCEGCNLEASVPRVEPRRSEEA